MNIEFENLKKIDTILEKIEKLDKKINGEKRWLNVEETAYYLGYSKDHIHKLKANYFIEGVHYHKKAGRVLFDKLELDKWVTTSVSKIDSKEIVKNLLDGLL